MRPSLRTTLLGLLALLPVPAKAARKPTPQTEFTNPVLYADYSDPDVLADGKHFYLVASSFTFVPGIPILQSDDLVHWKIVAHVVPRLNLGPQYNLTGMSAYGKGIWAPALRKHDGRFYVFFPTPTEGIFMSSAPAITGPWTEPVAVIAQPGLEDPCPFWDDDGSAYLVRSKTGAGPLVLYRMSPDGTHVLDEGKEIVNDPVHLHTLEGPKIYKRHGYYYIWAPYGGVRGGLQVVLRSKSLYGPFEAHTVLRPGPTVSGHQGGYIETPDGKGWFLHFQMLPGGHGRIDHLEPVIWRDDWPLVGDTSPNNGDPKHSPDAGTAVSTWSMPVKLTPPSTDRPQTSDEFATPTLGQQWEWNHNPDDAHWSLTQRPGYLRLTPTYAPEFLLAHNTLTQQMQDKNFELTARLDLSAITDGTVTGLAMFEKSFSAIQIVQTGNTRHLEFTHDHNTVPGPDITTPTVELRLTVTGDTVQYAYRLDPKAGFTPLGPETPIAFSWWKGSRPALFAYTQQHTDIPAGPIDFDWAHYVPLPEKTQEKK
jgi:beta-xylosidase